MLWIMFIFQYVQCIEFLSYLNLRPADILNTKRKKPSYLYHQAQNYVHLAVFKQQVIINPLKMNPSKMWAKFWISVKDWDESKLHSRRNYECVHDGELYRLFQNIFVLPFLRLVSYVKLCQSQWPRGLRRGYAAIRWLGLWVRIPQGA